MGPDEERQEAKWHEEHAAELRENPYFGHSKDAQISLLLRDRRELDKLVSELTQQLNELRYHSKAVAAKQDPIVFVMPKGEPDVNPCSD